MANEETDKKEKIIEKYREDYQKIAKKHSLPSYEELNNYFDIEDLSGKNTQRPLRIIRRRIAEKTSTYLRFLEVFLNPSSAPLFYMVLTKNMPADGRKMINETYFDLGRIEIEHLKMEVKDYDEGEEAEIIKDFYNIWNKVRKQMVTLTKIFDEQWKQKRSEAREKTYFG